MSSSPPRISIIVPLYNVGAFGALCIDSIKSQTFTDFEVLVIDDGSTDNSCAAAQEAAGGDCRFHFLFQKNMGLSSARNTGLQNARGEFIAFVDSDDRIHPEFLEQLHDSLVQSGADWVACGVTFVRPGETEGEKHPAIHGISLKHAPSEPTLLNFTDWKDIVHHFPSAWNKLYRRTLIEGLSFDVGTYYEDHTFFYRVASRTTHMLYLPLSLYLQTQGRPGQITQDGSARVFEQFDVLLTMKGIMETASKTGAKEAFNQISTRLLFERSQVVRDPLLRARFIESCRHFMTEHELSFSANWDESIGRVWEYVLNGGIPLSIVIPVTALTPSLHRTLAALQDGPICDAEIILIHDSTQTENHAELATFLEQSYPELILLRSEEAGVSNARNLGAAHASGEFIIFLDAGDIIYPGMLLHWVEQMLRKAADFGFSRFRISPDDSEGHNGFHETRDTEQDLRTGLLKMTPERALRLHALPSAKIFRRNFLEENAIAFPPEPLGSWAVCLWAATCAERVLYFADLCVEISDLPEDRQLWRKPEAPQALAQAIDRIAQGGNCDRLPMGWQRRLFLRAVWEKAHFASYATASEKERFLAKARRCLGHFAPAKASQPDPYIDTALLEKLGISTSTAA